MVAQRQNVGLLDLSKAFDKINHYILFIKLMNRSIPTQALSVLENWFSLCLSCVKWGSVMSYFYELKTGVRQGGVLSPFLFSIFIDDLVKYINKAAELARTVLLYFCMLMMLFYWHHLFKLCNHWLIYVLQNLNF